MALNKAEFRRLAKPCAHSVTPPSVLPSKSAAPPRQHKSVWSNCASISASCAMKLPLLKSANFHFQCLLNFKNFVVGQFRFFGLPVTADFHADERIRVGVSQTNGLTHDE